MNAPASRLLAVLLIASLAGNAALLLRASRQSRSAADAATSPSPAPSNTPAANASGVLEPAETSLDEFRDLLETADVKPKLRRDILRLVLQDRYAARFDALRASPWWRHHEGSSAMLRADHALFQELNAELERLLGADPAELDFEDPSFARQFAGLPIEKARAIHRIRRDYAELESNISLDAADFPLPADQNKLDLLRQEQERDIAALLTPEERATWELHTSPAADHARSIATRYQFSEEEYRRFYALVKSNRAGWSNEDEWIRHRMLDEELDIGIREIVGEERFRRTQIEADPDYRLARSAALRLGLPESTAANLYALREPVARESQRIAKDPALRPEQKREALARLADRTQEQVEHALGTEAADAYFSSRGMDWLGHLTAGSAVLITENGVEPGEAVDPNMGTTTDPVVPSE